MNQQERELFAALCRFRHPEKEQLSAWIETGAASAAVLGELFWNRAAAAAHFTLQETGLLSQVHREFRNALESARVQNIARNRSFFQCLAMLTEALSSCEGHYAMLKGALLCAHYPEGLRTSNDVDLLVPPAFVSEAGKALTAAGFRQGSVKNGEFVPAARAEIIRSRMTRGETVPYIKEVGLPYLRYLEVDVNFSLDFKNGDTAAVEALVAHAVSYPIRDFSIPVLAEEDFFLHLCAHLYKEATTYPWILMKRDMTLYKYIDLYLLLSELSVAAAERIASRAAALGLEKECRYAVTETESLLAGGGVAAETLLRALPMIPAEELLMVTAPAEKKQYCYTASDAKERFFAADRVVLLREC